jgi:hypothetical protein
MYTCSECGVQVIVFDGVIHRPCEHKDAVVIASCEATATGESTLSED